MGSPAVAKLGDRRGGKGGAAPSPVDPRLQKARELALDHAVDAVHTLIANMKRPRRNATASNASARMVLAFAEGALSGSEDQAQEAVKVLVVDKQELEAELAKRRGARAA